MSATPAYDALVAHHQRLHRLGHLQALATWDRMTLMPRGGAEARSHAQSELAALLQQMRSDPASMARLEQAGGETLDEAQAANLQLMQREQRLAQAVPAEAAARRERCEGAALQAWGPAKAANDWPAFAAVLAPLVDAVREVAAHLGSELGCGPYDALLDSHEPGLRHARVKTLFGDVADWLPGLVAEARQRQRSWSVIEPTGPFPVAAQKTLCEQVMTLLGFDFEAGRLDTAAHPFTGGVPEDVRLTTRFSEASFLPALLGTMHETGHACYQQNLPREWLGQPLAGPHSAALHEGQALSFERQLAPTPAFIGRLAPMLAAAFGDQPAFEPANLLRLMTRVRPGFIRVEADELTYPAHVILRVEIEAALIAGEIMVDDVPAWWDERMQRLLQLDTRGQYALGPLQDIHWAHGMFGYFPAYLLGAMVAAQCAAAMRRELPDMADRVAAGDVACVGQWLAPRIWRQGARLELDAMMVQATGSPLQPDALRQHLRQRYLGTP